MLKLLRNSSPHSPVSWLEKQQEGRREKVKSEILKNDKAFITLPWKF